MLNVRLSAFAAIAPCLHAWIARLSRRRQATRDRGRETMRSREAFFGRALFAAVGLATSVLPAAAQPPGAIPAVFRVGDQGDANYTIPIVTVAGAGGLRPQLALSYNHLGGNALAGMRWTLSGISAISRCPRTYAQDGVADAVTNSTSDRFCLDGQRLVNVSGPYGGANTEYRTEIETFQRVVQLGSQGGGPQSFRVDSPNGVSSYYGTTEDARVGTPGNVVRAWFISYTTDQFGNRINYSYNENDTTGETLPSEIAWTQNAATPTPQYKVTIVYELRPIDDRRFPFDAGGAPWQRTQRIDQIQVTRNGQTINTYHLNYHNPTATGTGRSQLASVQICGPTDCLPSTSLAVQNGVRSWGGLVNTTRATGSHPLAGDQNGDGKMDIFVSLSGTWQVYRGNNGELGLDPAVDSLVSSATNPERARIIDYNGDGRADLLFQSGSVWHVLQSTSASPPFSDINTGISTTTFPRADVRDFDGDGLEDWIHQGGFGLEWMRNTGSGFAVAQSIGPGLFSYGNFVNLRAPDLNGDGRAELFAVDGSCEPGPNGWEVCTGEHDILMASGSSYSQGMSLGFGTYSNPRAIDMNGDGLDDLVYVAGTTWRRRLSLGGLLSTAEADTLIPATNADKVIIVDYDNDGRKDLLRPDGDYWLIHRATSAVLPAAYTDSVYSPGAGAAGGFAADINGDGFPEIVRASGGTWHVHRHNSPLPDVVTSFTNGLGHEIDVTYESLAQTSRYLVNTAIVPPAPYVQVYRGPRYVVTLEDRDNGIGGTRNFQYMYGTVLVDRSGRGWLSVEFNFRFDVQNTVFDVNEFRLDWPYAGNRSRRFITKQGGPVPVQDNRYLWEKTTKSTTTPNIHFIRVESTTTQEYEVGGVAHGQHLRTIVEDPTYDLTYGHVTSRTTTVTDPVTAETWTSTTNFNPTVDLDDWCLGQPGLVETTNTLPNFTSAVRRVRHVWNPNDCTLTETTDETETSWAKQLRTTYTYDAFGNPNIISQDSVDGTAQNRSTDFNFDGFGQYPSSVTVGTVNLTTQFTWDYLTGQRASVTGPDGLTTSWLYDPFGRLTHESRPPGVVGATNSTTISYTACGTCWPLNAVYYGRAQSTDGADDYEYFDELGRTVGMSWKAPLGVEGRQEIRYNSVGSVGQVSEPHLSLEPVYWTSYLYDVIGRVTSENAPVSETQPSGATTLYDYRGHDLWITDAENNLTKYTHNAARQIKQVIDAMNGTTAYTYKPFGELATVQDPEFNTTTIEYDARGFKNSLADPNAGNWIYDTNVYGELTHQRSPLTAPPNWTTILTYEAAGRIKTRCDVPEGASATACGADDTTTWNYYSSTAAQANRGKLDTMVGPGNSRKHTYSLPHGLPTQLRHTVGGTNYFYDMTYDGQARLDLLTYPTSTSSYRFKVDYDYDPLSGNLTVAKDGNAPSLVYYRLDTADAVGRELTATLGNGLHEYRDYDRASGNLASIQTDPGIGSSIQNLSFTYDEIGNVLSRTNANIGKTESFTYDDLNRLSTMQVSGLSSVTMAYSAGGRITSRTDLGSYTYTGGGCGGGPMAVKSAGGKSYCYDAAGRMTSRGGSAITWFSYDLPKKINNGTASTEFTYGVDRARITQTRKTGSTTNATISYIGDLVEREVAGGTTTWRHYVTARGRVAQVNRVNTTNTAQYLHRDHQGTVVEVTGTTGALVQSLAFDAWGLRRNPANWAPLASPFGGTQPTKRGYTGHEHLDNVELIHMNGRVQDPKLGVFISPDPFVQAPYYSQSLNRYAYVWNNPLTLVDPSGFQTDDDDGKRPRPGCGSACEFPVPNVLPADVPDVDHGTCDVGAECPGNNDGASPGEPGPEANEPVLVVIVGEAVMTRAPDLARVGPVTGTWRVCSRGNLILCAGSAILWPGKLGDGMANGGNSEPTPATTPADSLSTTPTGPGDDDPNDDKNDGRIPNTNPDWGVNRLTKELHERGFQFEGPTKSGGGRIYRNPATGEEVRIMPRPNREPFRNSGSGGESPEKFSGSHYYRYRTSPDLEWGPHVSIPPK